jgi:thiamine transport system ATP-binding protein
MLEVRDLTVRFAARAVIDNLSLQVATGEVLAVRGPSGVGKSTLLRVVAGLLTPDAGTVWLDGIDITHLASHRRRIGLMFQDEQLFPHLDVAANVGFGPRMAGATRAAVAERAAEMLHLVGLTGFEHRRVTTLSGGEVKRVALARALAPTPALLLLDEPLTGLDPDLHDRLAAELAAVLRHTGTTALLVTHDHAEAAIIADRSVVLGDGAV